MDVSAYLSLQRLQDEHWWFVGRRQIIRELIGRHIQTRSGARLLEAGCGYGGNLSLLAEFGDVAAFEFDERARQFACRKSGLYISPGFLPDGVDCGDEEFDLIAMLDVLEHIDDDIASLQRIGKSLRPNGRLLLTVPAFSWLWSPHDDLHHHKRRYSRRALLQSIDDAGLTAISCGYFNSLLFPLAVAQRLASRLQRKPLAQEAKPPAVINSILGKVFGWERHLISRFHFPFGLSLYAVAERA